MKLEQIIKKDAQFARFYNRLIALEPFENDQPENTIEDTIRCLNETIPLIYGNPELMRLFTNIMDYRIDIREKLGPCRYDIVKDATHMDLTLFLNMIKHRIDVIKDPDFMTMLYYADSILKEHTKNPMEETFAYTIDLFLFEGTKNIKKIRSLVSEKQMDSIMYFISNAGNRPGILDGYLRNLPDVITKAREKGYEKQLDLMLDLIKDMPKSDFTALNISAGSGKEGGLVETCQTLEKLGKLDYYSQIVKRLKKVVKYNPVDSVILLPNKIKKIMDAYEKQDLGDRFFEVLDYAVRIHGKWKGIGERTWQGKSKIGHYQVVGDPTIDFFMNFPVFHKEIGEKSFEIFTKCYKHLGYHATGVMPGAIEFHLNKLDQAVDFKSWLEFIKKNYPKTDLTRPLVNGSINALKNGVSLEHYENFISQIDQWGLLESDSIAQILKSQVKDDVKHMYISYCGVLKEVKDLPKIRTDESWLMEVSKSVGMDHSKFMDWINYVSDKMGVICRDTQEIQKIFGESRELLDKRAYFQSKILQVEDYIRLIPTLFENNIDPTKAYDLNKHIGNEGQAIALKEIINSDKPVADKCDFLEEIRQYKHLLSVLAPEDFDARAWIKKAKIEAEHYFEAKGIDIVYSSDFVMKTLIGTQGKQARDDLLKIARFEAEKRNIKALFQLGKVYAKQRIFGLNERVDPIYATRLLMYGFISRRPERQSMALEYFLPDKLSKAKSFLERSNLPPVKFYNLMHEEINSLDNGMSLDERGSNGEKIISAMRENYLNSSNQVEGKTELRELIWLVESLYKDKEIFDSITAKMQDGTLYDLADGQRLLCCAMMSKDRERTEIASLYYALDPFIGLMHIVPSLSSIYGMPIGAAIMANTTTYSNHNVLLLDSLEGGELFQQVNDRQSFRLAAQGVVGAAQDSNSEFIFFNTRTPNTTSKKFSNYIKRVMGYGDATEVELAKLGGNQYTDVRRRYLESFADREKLAGKVKGYMMHTNELALMIK